MNELGPTATAVAIAIAGAIGAVSRFGLEAAITRALGGVRPWGTAAVNVIGALLLGVLAGLGASGNISGQLELTVGGEMLGAFTTFSTWMVQIVDLWEGGERRSALLHLLGSLVAGVAAAALGLMLVVSLGVAPPGSQP